MGCTVRSFWTRPKCTHDLDMPVSRYVFRVCQAAFDEHELNSAQFLIFAQYVNLRQFSTSSAFDWDHKSWLTVTYVLFLLLSHIVFLHTVVQLCSHAHHVFSSQKK